MSPERTIQVWADWIGLGGPRLVGRLRAEHSRGDEVFSFEYASDWLEAGHHQLDPALGLFRGRQYTAPPQGVFGLFLDSAPDRWGRTLMRRREFQEARLEGRRPRKLHDSDYLLGVHDAQRMGALRFQVDGPPFLDARVELAAPPWTSLTVLERAARGMEHERAADEPDYARWLRVLVAPGSSLGGARPKASVVDEHGHLWIAKFPSRHDEWDQGAWEGVVHELARMAELDVPDARLQRLGGRHHTLLSRRFDRAGDGRLHFASAMTLLERRDGEADASYLELAEILLQKGARTGHDLEQLWRRVAFSVAVSNTDDHLRNHGFLLTERGWTLAPAYDLNPDPWGEHLSLCIDESDSSLDLDLVRSVAPWFRVKAPRAGQILEEVTAAVQQWSTVARSRGLSRSSIERMEPAFRV